MLQGTTGRPPLPATGAAAAPLPWRPQPPESLEEAAPEAVLAWALAAFGDRIAICTSFQEDGMAILDMAWRLQPRVRVFTIDTGRLPPETYDFMEAVRRRYGLALTVVVPATDEVEAMVNRHGVNLFYDGVPQRRACCDVRKVRPLARALAGLGLDAWITGLRRDQAPSRAATRAVAVDHAHGGRLKINPLAGWTEGDVRAYLRRHEVPVHPLYARGFGTVSCAPCTRAVAPGGDARSGRWWWEQGVPKECGLHQGAGSRPAPAA
jgi:phosphoadenylyl-sulfate reductase (thioredoxin)